MKKIKIPKEKQNGIKSQYKIGNKPWNTGTRGIKKGNGGSFYKGQKPWNYKEPGSIIKRISGRFEYEYIKLKSGKWERYGNYTKIVDTVLPKRKYDINTVIRQIKNYKKAPEQEIKLSKEEIENRKKQKEFLALYGHGTIIKV